MQEYFTREVVFPGKGDMASSTQCAQIDTFCQLPCPVISANALRAMGRESDMSLDFKRPNCLGIGGQDIPLSGILRNVQLRLKGTSVTLRVDILISEALNDVVDMILNANFVQKHWALLFEKVKNFFGGWFSKTKKPTLEEEAEAEAKRLEAERLAAEIEAKRKGS
jgi:hypothetical protein